MRYFYESDILSAASEAVERFIGRGGDEHALFELEEWFAELQRDAVEWLEDGELKDQRSKLFDAIVRLAGTISREVVGS